MCARVCVCICVCVHMCVWRDCLPSVSSQSQESQSPLSSNTDTAFGSNGNTPAFRNPPQTFAGATALCQAKRKALLKLYFVMTRLGRTCGILPANAF